MVDVALAPTAPPTAADRTRWQDDDREARPRRRDRLRERLMEAGLDAYYGVRSESSRYLTGFVLADGEEKVAGGSGHFLIGADEVVVLADSRYRLAAQEQCPGSRVESVYGNLAERFPDLLAGLRPIAAGGATGTEAEPARVRRLAVEAEIVSHAAWLRLAEAVPDVELVPAQGWIEELRQVKAPSELERIAAACAIADRALTQMLPAIRPGMSERDLALDLEWRMRTAGADAPAFDVTCLSGPRAALPHGSPGERTVRSGEVLLLDFGAQVAGYRSDMTRTLFVGEPTRHDLRVYELVARAQEACLALLADAAHGRLSEPLTNRRVDALAREVMATGGRPDGFGHGLGHGIGLATHELPSLGRTAQERALPAPTVFSVEPGLYLDGVMGVRIEDLVVFDPPQGRIERLTRFPREVTVVGES